MVNTLILTYRSIVMSKLKEAKYYEIREGDFLVLWGFLEKERIPFKKVKIVGFVTNKYLSSDRKYGFVVLDDGTDSIRVKFFKDASSINSISEGDLIAVFGRISKYNNEINIIKEDFIKIEAGNYFLLHRLEYLNSTKFFLKIQEELNKGINLREKYRLSDIEIALMEGALPRNDKEEGEIKKETTKEEVKSQIIEYLRQQQDENGIEYSQINKDLPYDEDTIEEAIVELLSEGSCYEPRPGRIKLL